MADLLTEKEELRKQIISAAIIYKRYLAGKTFLYVYRDKYFEVAFMVNRFKHLTGVLSSLSAETFYNEANNAHLAHGQFGFSEKHPLRAAKKKAIALQSLNLITSSPVCVLIDFQTQSVLCKLGLTDLNFTIGLVENIDLTTGNKINDWMLPRTLRVNDKSIEKSKDAEMIDFIFSKDAKNEPLYTTLCYADKNAKMPETIKKMVDPKFFITQSTTE